MTSFVPHDWLGWSMLLWTFARIGMFFLLLRFVLVAADLRRRRSDLAG